MTPKQQLKMREALRRAKHEYDIAFHEWSKVYMELQELPFEPDELVRVVRLRHGTLKVTEGVLACLMNLNDALKSRRLGYNYSALDGEGEVF